MSDNFKTYNDALFFCDKYNIAYPANTGAFELAEALFRAYKDGATQPTASRGQAGSVSETTETD